MSQVFPGVPIQHIACGGPAVIVRGREGLQADTPS